MKSVNSTDEPVSREFKAPEFMTGAKCLPSSAYTDPFFFQKEIEHCFKEGWISIGTAQQVPEPHDILAVDVASEPLLITRDRQGAIHVLYNICRHRGLKLVEGAKVEKCRSGILSCPYHKWGYRLDGNLMAAPYWNGTEGSVPSEEMKENMSLLRVRSAVWSDIIFVNISGDAEPFENFIQPLEERWKSYDRSLMRQSNEHEYSVTSNWKFACENFLDTYHVPWVHSQLGSAKSLFPGLDFTYVSDDIFGFIMPEFDRDREQSKLVPHMFPDLEKKFDYALDLIYIFPNTLLMITPSWFQLISIQPKSVNKTHELMAVYLVGDEMLNENWSDYRDEFHNAMNQVNEQDIVILERLQHGRKTTKSNEGHYAPLWDQLAEHMARRIKLKVG